MTLADDTQGFTCRRTHGGWELVDREARVLNGHYYAEYAQARAAAEHLNEQVIAARFEETRT